jgi:hypothetical protein
VGLILHGEPGRERKKGVRANMTAAGGGERLNDKSSPPSPIGGRFKNCQQSHFTPSTQHCSELKKRQNEMRFSRKVHIQFFILKNVLNQHDIGF